MDGLNNIILYACIGVLIVVLAIFVYLKFFKKTSNNNQAKTSNNNQAQSYKLKKTNTKQIKKNNLSTLPKNVKESIPYLHTYEKGIIETEDGVFTRAYKIEDINFKIAPDEEQASIFLKYAKFLNSFPVDTKFQVIIQNKTANIASVFNNIQFTPQSDNLNPFRREMNSVLIEKMKEGRNNITQEKYLVVSKKAEDIDQADKFFKSIDDTVNKKFQDISREHPAKIVSLIKRLKNLHDIYNQEEERVFYNSRDKSGTPIFDINVLLKTGMTTKDVVGPASMDFSKSSYFKLGDTYGKSLYLENVPNYLSTEFLADLSDSLCNMLISIHYEPVELSRAMKSIHNMMLNINGQIAKHQKSALQSGYTTDLIPPALYKQQEYIKSLMDDISTRDQKMFFVTMVITVFGETKDQLDENVHNVVNMANNYLCTLKPLFFQQERGLNSCLPLGRNEIKASKMLTTESASIFIPYTTQELHQKDGIYYGLNDTSNNMIIYNRLLGENYNGLILGESGNGKSFAAKQEMMSALLRSPNNVVYVIDPEAEYAPLAKALGGQVIDLSTNTRNHINPMDMKISNDETDPIGMKTEFVISMVEIMANSGRINGGRVLSPEEKTIISRCVQNICRPYLEVLEKANAAGMKVNQMEEATPTLNTLWHEITMQPEPTAKNLAAILEIYANGSLSTFAHRTNISLNNRFIVYDIKNLGSGTKPLGIHICLNNIWDKMVENEKKGIYTWVYIDEFYLLLDSESSATFVSSIWKRARKRNGVPTGILQNTGQLMRTEEASDILNNTSFIRMFSAKKIDRTNLKSLLGLSDSQLFNITDAGPGKGLIYANKTILPFNNQFPENTKLYEVMSTSATKDKLRKEQRMKFIE